MWEYSEEFFLKVKKMKERLKEENREIDIISGLLVDYECMFGFTDLKIAYGNHEAVILITEFPNGVRLGNARISHDWKIERVRFPETLNLHLTAYPTVTFTEDTTWRQEVNDQGYRTFMKKVFTLDSPYGEIPRFKKEYETNTNSGQHVWKNTLDGILRGVNPVGMDTLKLVLDTDKGTVTYFLYTKQLGRDLVVDSEASRAEQRKALTFLSEICGNRIVIDERLTRHWVHPYEEEIDLSQRITSGTISFETATMRSDLPRAKLDYLESQGAFGKCS